jgi:hypothetical protein
MASTWSSAQLRAGKVMFTLMRSFWPSVVSTSMCSLVVLELRKAHVSLSTSTPTRHHAPSVTARPLLEDADPDVTRYSSFGLAYMSNFRTIFVATSTGRSATAALSPPPPPRRRIPSAVAIFDAFYRRLLSRVREGALAGPGREGGVRARCGTVHWERGTENVASAPQVLSGVTDRQ